MGQIKGRSWYVRSRGVEVAGLEERSKRSSPGLQRLLSTADIRETRKWDRGRSRREPNYDDEEGPDGDATGGNSKGSMDRAGRSSTDVLCGLIRRSSMGFHSQSFRTGKSCRLRWVNYLHPGLKRGRMTAQEERLVLELHSQWGNRWSRIARRLPGRTDNEIKNYWRTHMRKKAQERKRGLSSPSSSSSNCFSPAQGSTSAVSLPESQIMEASSLHDKGVNGDLAVRGDQSEEEVAKGYPMDQIWKEIALMEEDASSGPVHEGGEGRNKEDGMCSLLTPATPIASLPSWNYCSDSLWRMDDQEDIKMWLPTITDHFVSNYGPGLGC